MPRDTLSQAEREALRARFRPLPARARSRRRWFVPRVLAAMTLALLAERLVGVAEWLVRDEVAR